MSGIKLFQNAGSVQEIVHQRIDRDYLTARLKPVGSGAWGCHQDLGQRHCEDLVGDAVQRRARS